MNDHLQSLCYKNTVNNLHKDIPIKDKAPMIARGALGLL